ncbi:MAG: OmpA family protein, partial [Elusimicrobiaceae bacterium]|nr:OmpA family protein [Elusimicrobiaceae bacterium]
LNRVLKKYPKNRIVVQGFTDSTGSDEYNKKLSAQRAQAVYNYLVAGGLKTLSITYVGYGKANPIASNDTEEGRAQNRRVVLAITANEKDIQ